MRRISILIIVLAVTVPAFAQDPGWIGVTIADQKDGGVFVRNVSPDGPAAKAGLKENDVISEYNNQNVIGVLQMTRLVQETPVGRPVQVKVRRDGREQTFQVTPERSRRTQAFQIRTPNLTITPDSIRQSITRSVPFVFSSSTNQSGIRADAMTPQLREFFGVTGPDGVLVASVDSASVAEKAGVKAGDVITAVDGKGISDPAQFLREMRSAGSTIALKIVRGKQEREINIQGANR